MTQQQLAHRSNAAIISWAKDKPKLVIAIDGYTGIGKTTLLNNLAALNPNIIPVNRDDFVLPREVVQKKLAKAKDRSKIFELEVCDDEKLAGFVTMFRNTLNPCTIDTYDGGSGEVDIPKTYDFSKKIMVIEGVFMFHPHLELHKLWDKKIYLKGKIDKIDERRVKREKEKWGKDYFPEDHPDSYFRQVIIGLNRYVELYKPEQVADLVFEVD